ncbi:MAG: nicotinate-nucleotide adenylyltransferase [Lachnospiraceae bacterium]|nr:nicotinate-nucleotide adenylyltransferase [Lachnospiraceae bacterium]
MNNSSYLKKIGILGGTFNPIHTGHLILAQNALEWCGLDKVLIMPSGCSYLKDPDTIVKTRHRIEMTKLAIEDNPDFELSLIETEREGNSYTCDTLEILCRENPDVRYYYIIGEDTLFGMENWKDPHIIFAKSTIVCAQREGQPDDVLLSKVEYLKNKFNADIIIMDVPEVAVSSSMIRRLLSEGKSCRYYLNDKVANYIRENRLFTEK